MAFGKGRLDLLTNLLVVIHVPSGNHSLWNFFRLMQCVLVRVLTQESYVLSLIASIISSAMLFEDEAAILSGSIFPAKVAWYYSCNFTCLVGWPGIISDQL